MGKTFYLSAVFIFAISLWVLNFYIAGWWDRPDGFEIGTFGDSFGVVNSLFTGLAFISVIWSVITQREELKETKIQTKTAIEESNRTKEILNKQEENIKKQNDQLEKQIFEATFFQMLTAFKGVTYSLEETYYKKYATSYEMKKFGAFGFITEKLSETVSRLHSREVKAKYSDKISKLNADLVQQIEMKTAFEKIEIQSRPEYVNAENNIVAAEKDRDDEILAGPSHERFSSYYEIFFKEHGNYLGKYFRSLYTILKFINNSNIEDKTLYVNIIRSQLSTTESTLIAINFISPKTTNAFNNIYKTYGIAKYADRSNDILRNFSNIIPMSIYGAYEKRDSPYVFKYD